MTNFKKIIVDIEKHKKQLASDRDGLEELIGDLEALKDDCNDAYESLVLAVDALSRQV